MLARELLFSAVPGSLPTVSDVLAARVRIAGRIVRTPLLHRSIAGRDVWLKAEVLQRTGSFKVRGALNFILSLDDEVRRRGVVAYSSGNHAQGVASAAADCGIPATIVMPADAPKIKTDNTDGYGAKVVPYDRATGDREAIAAEIAADSGGTLIPPYDHALTIAGQGVLGLELLEDLEAAGVAEADVIVPVSGGGLAAGIALAAETPGPRLRVFSAEPDTHDDHRQSLEAGRRVQVDSPSPSICDALLQPIPGELTFQINRERLAGGVVASDDEVLSAMRYAFEKLKLVVEPGGAIALAAQLAGRVPGTGPVVVVLSGGNVDPVLMTKAIG
ncbi:MAG: pyridoxal-phosphate dependent enzyme [Acidimicrobiia bacterium]